MKATMQVIRCNTCGVIEPVADNMEWRVGAQPRIKECNCAEPRQPARVFWMMEATFEQAHACEECGQPGEIDNEDNHVFCDGCRPRSCTVCGKPAAPDSFICECASCIEKSVRGWEEAEMDEVRRIRKESE